MESYEASTVGNSVADDPEEDEEYNQSNAEDEDSTENDGGELAATDTTANEAEEIVTEASNKIASYAKPAKVPAKKLNVQEVNKKKPSIMSSSINAIESDANKKKKPLRKPVEEEDDDDDDILEDDRSGRR